MYSDTQAYLEHIFHENTNFGKKLKMEALNKKIDPKNLSLVKTKVQVPRLNGKKVGLFATRTPHRPNPLV